MPFAIAFLSFIASCKKEKKEFASVTTVAASNVTANSITTGGEITNDGNQQILKKGVCWAAHSNPTLADSITDNTSASNFFSTDIVGLNSNTNYYIRAYATNASGTAYGNEIVVTTLKGVATITTSAVTDIQPLTAKGGGNILNDGGSQIGERGVVYSRLPNPTTSNFKISAGDGAGIFVVSLSPLASQETYYVRAYAINSFGISYGNEVKFNAASANTVTDVDGNVYPYIDVCGQKWTTKNLKTTKYKNGDPISDGTVQGYNWTSPTGSYTFPNYATDGKSNDDVYGKLYNLNAIRDNRGVCPAGWHVGTDAEWQAIEVCQGMDAGTANTIGNRCCVGQKFLIGGSTGLEIQKAGQGFISTSTNTVSYNSFNTSGFYWTSTASPVSPTLNRYRAFVPNGNDPDNIQRSNGSTYLMSVRCVKD